MGTYDLWAAPQSSSRMCLARKLRDREAFVWLDNFHHVHILYMFLVFQKVTSDLCSERLSECGADGRLNLEEGHPCAVVV